MPKLDEATMQKRRQHIVDAAMRQFEKLGFGGASVDAICAEAGISKGAFYTHFPSKEAVMLALLAQRGDTYARIEAATLADLEEAFFNLMLRGLSYVDSRLEMEAVTSGASNLPIREALTDNSEQCLYALREAIDRLVAEEKVEMVGDITTAEAAELLVTYALGRLALQVYEMENRDRENRRGLAITISGVMRPVSG
ncbi:MAG: TetR/AcrR family transcriptional regulator [Sphingopyxis sp.]|uniref:TetR/AcrR family transcriptional regulator n=1 Tax=Sphingopyxis sp. TaxID=1908224 RepID=UPI001A4E84C1|nr:helix-turn-helix domain-containing protein [Sphingopyxis sp.]MBL9064806.1 TetR/AcrR family transcriptional regulator [Sphingopyxis sp.]